MARTTKQQQKAVYLPPTIVERLKAIALKNRRSWNGELLVAIEKYLETQEGK